MKNIIASLYTTIPQKFAFESRASIAYVIP